MSSAAGEPWFERRDDARARRPPKWLWWALGGGLVVLGSIVIAIVVFVVIAVKGPETHVVNGADVDQETLEYLRAEHLLENGETLQLFYSGGVLHARDEGCFCTDRAVVDYTRAKRRLRSTRVAYGDVTEVALTRRLGLFTRSTLSLHVRERWAVTVSMPSRYDGDVAFEQEVRARWRSAQPELAFAAERLWFEADALPDGVRKALEQGGVLAPGERVLALYGWSGLQIERWGTLLTPARVVAYNLDAEPEPFIGSVDLQGIDSIALGPDESKDEGFDTLVFVHQAQEYVLDGDPAIVAVFEVRLRAEWKRVRGIPDDGRR